MFIVSKLVINVYVNGTALFENEFWISRTLRNNNNITEHSRRFRDLLKCHRTLRSIAVRVCRTQMKWPSHSRLLFKEIAPCQRNELSVGTYVFCSGCHETFYDCFTLSLSLFLSIRLYPINYAFRANNSCFLEIRFITVSTSLLYG